MPHSGEHGRNTEYLLLRKVAGMISRDEPGKSHSSYSKRLSSYQYEYSYEYEYERHHHQ